MRKTIYKFVGVSYVEAESEEQAKDIFANESFNFAADADVYEYDSWEDAKNFGL
jgi:hypothetical protein